MDHNKELTGQIGGYQTENEKLKSNLSEMSGKQRILENELNNSLKTLVESE